MDQSVIGFQVHLFAGHQIIDRPPKLIQERHRPGIVRERRSIIVRERPEDVVVNLGIRHRAIVFDCPVRPRKRAGQQRGRAGGSEVAACEVIVIHDCPLRQPRQIRRRFPGVAIERKIEGATGHRRPAPAHCCALPAGARSPPSTCVRRGEARPNCARPVNFRKSRRLIADSLRLSLRDCYCKSERLNEGFPDLGTTCRPRTAPASVPGAGDYTGKAARASNCAVRSRIRISAGLPGPWCLRGAHAPPTLMKSNAACAGSMAEPRRRSRTSISACAVLQRILGELFH